MENFSCYLLTGNILTGQKFRMACPPWVLMKPRLSGQYFLLVFFVLMHMLHFKGLVTISGHLSDKIFIVSHFIESTKTYLSNIANRLYFQKIVGFPIVGRLEMGFSGAFVSKNTSKSPISHDKIPCPTSPHIMIFSVKMIAILE